MMVFGLQKKMRLFYRLRTANPWHLWEPSVWIWLFAPPYAYLEYNKNFILLVETHRKKSIFHFLFSLTQVVKSEPLSKTMPQISSCLNIYVYGLVFRKLDSLNKFCRVFPKTNWVLANILFPDQMFCNFNEVTYSTHCVSVSDVYSNKKYWKLE